MYVYWDCVYVNIYWEYVYGYIYWEGVYVYIYWECMDSGLKNYCLPLTSNAQTIL